MKNFAAVIFGFACSLTSYSQLSPEELEIFSPSLGYHADDDHSLELNLRGLPSSQEVLPFWMYHNSRGRISSDSHAVAWITGKSFNFLTDNKYLLLGAGALYDEGRNKGILIDELFVHYQDPNIYFTLGKKQPIELYNGLSASNGNMLWSLNARPLPGFQLGTVAPLFFFRSQHFGIEAAWKEFFPGKDGFVEDTRIHHKNFHLIFRKDAWQLKLGVQHFAQWGGTSPRIGPQPSDAANYLRVLAGKEGTVIHPETGQLTIIANHVGGYELYLDREFRNFNLQFFYNHIFDDVSGKRLHNLPDGTYGFFYENRDKDRLISSIIYELYYTHHQSYTAEGFHKNDNYFNNGTYQSGWTYEGRVFGSPFFTPDPEGKGVINNKFIAHHIGVAGEIGNYFKRYPYKFLLSYAHNDGLYNRRLRPQQDVVYGLLDVLVLSSVIRLNLQTGLELNSTSAPVYGAGMKVSYKM
ncbi:MAG: capsule assembly Wzi family protein [Salinimicrobium sediminis]|nr:capsule assembly Wzi family protein [Salinimicrobium sediminis]